MIHQVKDEELDEITRKYKVNLDVNQGAFPSHCVIGTLGSNIHSELNSSNVDLVIKKGQNKFIESFSAFGNKDPIDFLKSNSIFRVFVCGLAYDFCVGWTAVDAAKIGLSAFVLHDATRAISKETTDIMEENFKQNGVKIINTSEINNYI